MEDVPSLTAAFLFLHFLLFLLTLISLLGINLAEAFLQCQGLKDHDGEDKVTLLPENI